MVSTKQTEEKGVVSKHAGTSARNDRAERKIIPVASWVCVEEWVYSPLGMAAQVLIWARLVLKQRNSTFRTASPPCVPTFSSTIRSPIFLLASLPTSPQNCITNTPPGRVSLTFGHLLSSILCQNSTGLGLILLEPKLCFPLKILLTHHSSSSSNNSFTEGEFTGHASHSFKVYVWVSGFSILYLRVHHHNQFTTLKINSITQI